LLIVLLVLPPAPVRTSHRLPWYAPYALEDPDEGQRARALLLAAEERLRAAAGRPELRVWRRGVSSPDVAGAIVHEAERGGVDVIVMGGRDHGPLAALGGGVCSEVLRRTRTPLMLVP